MSDLKAAINKFWKVYDKDNSGSLDRVEANKLLDDVFAEIGDKLDANTRAALFQYIDSNGDNIITRDELFAALNDA